MTSRFRGRSAARIAFGASSQAVAAALAITAFAAPAYAQDEPSEEQEILVSGFAASLQSAVIEKKERDQIVESISAEDIGKLPDASIAESIARLPGLTSQRVSGRSNVISIRGFSPDFSTTLLNGREQTSTGDNRAVEYDQYPSEIMSQVLVYKTPMASIVGQGLSGTVDLRTIRPLEYGRRAISIGGRGTYVEGGKLNVESTDMGWRVNATYIDQFANDTIGIALSASYLDEPYQNREYNAWGYPTVDINDDRYGMGPAGARVARPGYEDMVGRYVTGGSKSYITSTELKRLGLQGTLQWQPAPQFTATIDAFYSDFQDDQIKRGIELPLYWGAGSTVLQPNATVEGDMIVAGSFTGVEGVVRNDAFQRHAKLYSFGYNAKYEGDDGWNVMFDGSLSKTDRNELVLETYAGTGRGQGVGATDTIGFAPSDNGTIFSHQLDYSDYGLMVLTSPLGWGGDQITPDGTGIRGGQEGYYNNRIVSDELIQWRMEFEKELEGFLKGVKVGMNYTDRDKSLLPDEYFVGLAANTDGTLPGMAVPESARLGASDQSFLGLGPIISYDPVALVESGIFNLVANPYGDVVVKAYDVSERLMTAYWQADIDAEIGAAVLTGNFGVQAIFTDQNSTGASAVYLGARPNGSPIIGVDRRNASTDYVDVLPSANLSLRLPSDFVIRAGAAREIIRPRLDDMRATVSFGYSFVTQAGQDFAFVTGSGGNPELRPWRANAVDLTFEKYFGTQGYVAAQFFYKDLKSYIYTQDQLIDASTLALASPGPQYTIAPIATLNVPVNGEGGTLYGVEVAGTLPFGMLTEALDGFGVTGGVAYTETKIEPTPGAPAEDIPGYSKWVANGTAYFEKWGFSARGSVRYRSSFVGELSGFGASRTRRRAREETVIDAQLGYNFQEGSALDGLSLFLQGQNLTDEPFVTYNPGDDRQIIDFQRYGRRFLAGATFRF